MRSTFSRTLSGFLAALVMSIVVASPASAFFYEYSGKLVGKSWTTGNGTVWEGMKKQWAGVTAGPTAICVGPVQYVSGNFVFPYGWDCNNSQVVWEYGAINAAAGVDNPNSAEDHFSTWASSS